ncbi:MAG: hypothetical protein GY772_26375 [bacterium]|nr:hypothetical protein [bacterium]
MTATETTATETMTATVPVSPEMYDLAESWEESARKGGDPEAVRIAEAAQEGDPDAIAQILEFENRDGDPEVAREAERAQEEIRRSIITLTDVESEAHGLRATETYCGRIFVDWGAGNFVIDIGDWEEWVDHEDPRERSYFGGACFWDSWSQRGDDVEWDANNEVWRRA